MNNCENIPSEESILVGHKIVWKGYFCDGVLTLAVLEDRSNTPPYQEQITFILKSHEVQLDGIVVVPAKQPTFVGIFQAIEELYLAKMQKDMKNKIAKGTKIH